MERESTTVDGHWVFGRIERNGGYSFLEEVPRRDAATLLPIFSSSGEGQGLPLIAHVRSGTTISSSCEVRDYH